MRLKLQDYSDGAIFKNDDLSYTVETSRGTATGATVTQALAILSAMISAKSVENITDVKATKKKKSTKKLAKKS